MPYECRLDFSTLWNNSDNNNNNNSRKEKKKTTRNHSKMLFRKKILSYLIWNIWDIWEILVVIILIPLAQFNPHLKSPTRLLNLYNRKPFMITMYLNNRPLISCLIGQTFLPPLTPCQLTMAWTFSLGKEGGRGGGALRYQIITHCQTAMQSGSSARQNLWMVNSFEAKKGGVVNFTLRI